jgi:uncharacterized membrane protein
MNKYKYHVIVILALVGLGVSAYLTISHYQNINVPCLIARGCDFVLKSKYSQFLGIPISTFGIIYFAGILGLMTAVKKNILAEKFLTIWLTGGLVVALTLISIQLFVLKAICQYCMVTDSISIILFLWHINTKRPTDSVVA